MSVRIVCAQKRIGADCKIWNHNIKYCPHARQLEGPKGRRHDLEAVLHGESAMFMRLNSSVNQNGELKKWSTTMPTFIFEDRILVNFLRWESQLSRLSTT